MTGPAKSVLLISPDTALARTVERSVLGLQGVKIRTEPRGLSELNGQAAVLAADKDIIIFETGAQAPADLDAVRALSGARRAGARLVALADGEMTLSQVHALNIAGVDEVVPVPAAGSAIPDQLRAMQPPAEKDRGRLIAVAKARGGVGATTVAVNLASELVGQKGFMKRFVPKRVALVDLDLQFGSVGNLLDIGEQDAMLQLALEGGMPDETFLARGLVETANGLSVLPAPSKFVPLDAISPEQIGRLLDLLRQKNDYTVVDLPHALGAWIEPVLKRADELLVVTDTSVPAIRHCRRLIDFFTADNPDLKVRVVINHETRSVFGSGLQKEAQKALDRKLDIWLPHDPAAARSAVDRGQPLAQVAPRSQLGRAIAQLAKTTQQEFPAPQTAARPGK